MFVENIPAECPPSNNVGWVTASIESLHKGGKKEGRKNCLYLQIHFPELLKIVVKTHNRPSWCHYHPNLLLWLPLLLSSINNTSCQSNRAALRCNTDLIMKVTSARARASLNHSSTCLSWDSNSWYGGTAAKRHNKDHRRTWICIHKK